MKRYVIVGGGIAGVHCVEGIRSRDPEGSITLISAEADSNYGRPLISYYLEGKTDEARMSYRGPDFYEKNRVRVLHGVAAKTLHPEGKTLRLSDGELLPYDALCVAAGSAPFVPPMKGLETVEKKFSFMTLADARALAAAVTPESRVLIMGTGDIGSSAAMKFRAFGPSSIVGMNTSGFNGSGLFDRVITPAGLSDVLPETDIVVMALPLTEKTRHIMDKEKLALLPDGALIVNVGRGACMDQEALVYELQAGRLRAALDLFEKEPIPEESELWGCPNLLLTPHVSGDMLLPYTVEKIVEQFLEDFRRYAAGEKPLRAVELEKGY